MEDGTDVVGIALSGIQQQMSILGIHAAAVFGGSGRRRRVGAMGQGDGCRGGVVGPRWPRRSLTLDAVERRKGRRRLWREARRLRHGVDQEDGVAGNKINA